MFPYWLLFAFFALGALLSRSAPQQPVALSSGATPVTAPGRPHPSLMLLLGAVLIALLVGLRYRVGADWNTYEFYFEWASYASLSRVLQLSDPAYQLLNWSVQHLGGEMWGVNLLCGLIFSWGLWQFARMQPEPWLAVLVAVPYLTVVVAMGYSRQAVAIGILMAGLAALGRGASAARGAGSTAAYREGRAGQGAGFRPRGEGRRMGCADRSAGDRPQLRSSPLEVATEANTGPPETTALKRDAWDADSSVRTAFAG